VQINHKNVKMHCADVAAEKIVLCIMYMCQ